MKLLISPTEPPEIKRLGAISPKPEKYGVDILWFANRLKIGVQRKRFPDDFLASLYDDRIYKELAQMRSLDRAMLIVEGFGKWTNDGHLLDQRKFTKAQMFNLINTITFEFGVIVNRVRDMPETIQAIHAFYAWSEKTKHRSLTVRSNPAGKWGTPTSREWGLHLLQSFEGIGPDLAGKILDHFGKVPMRWEVTEKELIEVQGVGKVTAKKLREALG